MSEGHTKVSRNKEEFTIMSTVAYPTYRPQVIGSQIARPQVVRNQAARTRLVLTRRGRRVITFLIAVPLALAAFFAIVSAGQAAATDGAAVTDTSHTWITVESGETLWSLAYEIAPTKDPRDVIAEIVSLNQLNSDLQPGQRIALPAGY
jgi:LysM repeat protein